MVRSLLSSPDITDENIKDFRNANNMQCFIKSSYWRLGIDEGGLVLQRPTILQNNYRPAVSQPDPTGNDLSVYHKVYFMIYFFFYSH